MKVSNLRNGLRVKVKQCCGLSEHRGKYGTVVSVTPDLWGQVFVKIDGYIGFYPEQGVGFFVTSLKLADETPQRVEDVLKVKELEQKLQAIESVLKGGSV
jgi:hypothetical protein